MNRTSRVHLVWSPLLAVALVGALAGTVLATAAAGFHGTPLARATLSDGVHYNTGQVKFETKGSTDFAMATVTIDPLGSSGWHEHPGVVLIAVKTGTVTFYNQYCSPTVHIAGTSFVEAAGDGPGLARNESSTDPAVVYVTYIVPVGAALRIDDPNPGCSEN